MIATTHRLRHAHRGASLGVALVLLAGCGVAAGDTIGGHDAAAVSSPYRTVTVTDNRWKDSTNPAAVHLGDKRLSTSPKAGYLDSCETTFGGGGAASSGSWLDAAAGVGTRPRSRRCRGR